MKIKAICGVMALLALAACGPGKGSDASGSAATASAPPISTAPQHESQGVIAAVDGQVVTIDHDGASEAAVPAGRTVFQAYADVLAEAPVTPGARITFKFRKVAVGEGWELTEMHAR